MAKKFVVLKCQHGSHLYGTAHANSDYDYYTIYDFYNQRYRPKKKAQQRIQGDLDEVEVTLDRFTDLCFKGVPQAVEVLFSPKEAWVEENGWMNISAHIKNELVNYIPAILETYRRTALNFFWSNKDQEKKRKHAFRLLLNARELKTSGEMHPRLDKEQVEFIRVSSSCYNSEEKFKDMVYEIF
jgi:predicted nucleotidyltransferase